MGKIAIIGSKDITQGFKTLGFSVFSVRNSQEVKRAFEEVTSSGFHICYIFERWAEEIRSFIQQRSQELFPIIVLLPDNQGSLGLGRSSLREVAKRAVGADTLFEKAR